MKTKYTQRFSSQFEQKNDICLRKNFISSTEKIKQQEKGKKVRKIPKEQNY